ncbi:MAG: carboxypeptidase regulatory-like domain-containing protein [Bacteroidales bacterium]|nr:carboxypeptidase regulatory-like domain-containing protein [Bacteroidales bacterium]MBR4274177.1 carboxypeptidase regulatory-like domain-containing protein [Bacteroidales bacterium]
MKSNTITVTSSENNGDVVLTMKRKKFPWWIFLFLLPLILLIPIKRDINIQYAQQGSDIAVAKAAASVTYPVTSTFGGKTMLTVNDTTDTEGKMVIAGVAEPLWYKLFGGQSDSLYTSCGNGCYSLKNAGYKYRDFPPDDFKKVYLGAVASVETLKVVDADDNEPIPEADIQLIRTVDGNKTNDNTKSDVAGQFDIADMPLCGSVKVIASKEGYENDTIEASLFDISNMTDDEKTLHLKPLKGCVKVIVKNLNTKTLLADATVTLEINGAARTMKTNTNGVGVGMFDSLRISSTLKFTASKAGYADTTLSGYTVQQFMALDEEKRTMYLRPLTKSLVFKNVDGTGAALSGVKNEIYKNGTLIATEYSNNAGEFVVANILDSDKLSIAATKTGYNGNNTKVKNKSLAQLNTQDSRTIPLTKIEQPKPTPPPNNNKQDDLKGESGDLRINLQWYCKTDLDLHVIDPCGNEIYFSKRKATCNGGTGILDLDANALIGTTSRPQENIYWLKPSPGTYTIKVVCFKWRERTQNPISYNISIVDKNGRVDKRGTIAKGQTITVCKHTVQ